MDEHRNKLLNIVSRHLSAIHAGAMLDRAISACGVHGMLESRDISRVSERLLQTASLFLAPDAREALRRELMTLRPSGITGIESVTLMISREDDVSRARAQVRELCMMAGAGRIAIQKAATIASELARNIVSYSDGGELALSLRNDPPTLDMIASDDGPGIPNLDEILAGRYRSRTGLGLGLLGSKRLADRFDIQTGADGTRVVVEVRL